MVIALASRSHMGTNRVCAKDKPASGLLARRGSNPFPGATLPLLGFFVKISTRCFFGVVRRLSLVSLVRVVT